jgi:[histone H4]-lysine20 N-methyltransferase SETD8
VGWVRRSSRQPNKMESVFLQQRIELQKAVLAGGTDGLHERFFVGKGRGVITSRKFKRGEFVVEYCGDLVDELGSRARETELDVAKRLDSFMFYFTFQKRRWCIDATIESGHLGRLINHSKCASNLLPEIVEINGTPHIALIAKQDIEPGSELLYDYGDRRAAVIQTNPWIKK